MGFCLVSQEIRKLIRDGVLRTPGYHGGSEEVLDNEWFADKKLEGRVQSSSFEPVIGDTVFLLDTKEEGLFRPTRGSTVRQNLLQVPSKRRAQLDISGGWVLGRGFTYLAKLEDEIRTGGSEFTYVRASPKSSIGRIWCHTRLLADDCDSFDEVRNASEGDVGLWLLLQPRAFDVVVRPGLSFTQLRFFRGDDARLSASEIRTEWKKNPFILNSDAEGRLTTYEDPKITDTLPICVDVEGLPTNGIVALRARENDEPIKLWESGSAVAERYFEPVAGDNKKLVVHKGEQRYLLASKGVLRIPPHLSAELREHSRLGLNAQLHLAGFIDPGFEGDLVFEVTSHEPTDVTIRDGMALGELDFFRTNEPTDKPYGKPSGSNYQGQRGPKAAKFFTGFNFHDAARVSVKLDRDVLTADKNRLLSHRKNAEGGGLEIISGGEAKELFADIGEHHMFHNRYDCEGDRSVLQVIPYTLLFDTDSDGKPRVFTYLRPQGTGDSRLRGKNSVGLGGHIVRSDGPEFVRRCLRREVFEEEVEVTGDYSEPVLVGTLWEPTRDVDKVHFGLVYGFHLGNDGKVRIRESSSLVNGRMVPISDLIDE